MIFTLKNADFSASNIGTLSSWRIVKSLKGVTTDSNVVSVSKDTPYSAIFNVSEGYVFNNAVVTMDGNDISSNLVWNTDNTIGTLTISSVTGHIYISIVADALIGDGEDVIKQYTITYKYISESGQLLRVSTTEKVDEGTFKEFSINNAPEIADYKISQVVPTSATINGNTTVSYIYEVIEAEGGGDNEGGEDDNLPTTEAWYVDVAKYGGSNSAAASYAGFAYCDDNTIAACIGVPINALRMRVSKSGTLTYGKTNDTVYTELGTLNLEKSDEIAIYELDNIITLSEGERLVFGKNTDTGQFTYYAGGGASYPEGKFDVKVSESQPSGQANTAADLLSIDIGYIPNIDNVPVTGITFEEETIDVVIGGSLQLEPIIEPSYATNQNVTWKVSNSNCTVSSSGLVYGVNNGECIITATTEDGGFTASCTVNVVNTIWYLAVADQTTFNAGSSTGTASFMYSNSEEIATYIGKPINSLRLAVHTAGTLSYGKTDGTTYSQLGTIDLVNPSTQLQIYDIPEITLVEGENLWFQGKEDTGRFYYGNGSGGRFRYNVNQENPNGTNTSSSNLSIDIGYTKSYDGTISVTGVELDKTELAMSVGDSIKLNAIIEPQNATNQNVTWTASNNNCTVVDGLVTRVAEGDCIITVTTEDGEFTASCTVTTSDNIWYVNVADQSSLINVSAVNSSSFVYYSNVTENAIDQPINVIRLAVAQAGNLSYGKVSNNTKIELGEITLANPSKNLQVYEIPRLILAEGERLWFQDTGDTGLFHYQYDNSNGVGNFYANIKLGSDAGTANGRNLSIDVGYDGTIYDENVVTGITLNETSKVMSVNETLTLTATLLPQNATNQNIIWTASNGNCTVVDGLVTTIATGDCTITATSVDGGFTTACNLVILSDETTEAWYVNHAGQIDKINKSTASAASFAYNTESVINACVGKPINAIRLAVAQAGNLAYGKVSETEYIQLGTIKLVNPSTDLQAYIIPEITLAEGERLWIQGASDTGLFWYSQSSNVATATFNMRIKDSDKVGVTGTGKLAIDIGYIDLNKVKITDMTFGNEVLILDDIDSSKQLEVKFTPSYATRNVTWTASNSNCTVVDGLVTRVAEGDCIITATTEDGDFTASCRVSSAASATWYVDMTSSSTLAATSNNSGGFAYTQDANISACIGNPINLLRLAVATEGVFSYGKTDDSTYTLLGTLNFTNPSKELQIFEIPEVTLAEGERLVFGQSTDKGYFRYQGPTATNGNFVNNVRANNPAGSTEYKGNLSIDIGYLNPNIN